MVHTSGSLAKNEWIYTSTPPTPFVLWTGKNLPSQACVKWGPYIVPSKSNRSLFCVSGCGHVLELLLNTACCKCGLTAHCRNLWHVHGNMTEMSCVFWKRFIEHEVGGGEGVHGHGSRQQLAVHYHSSALVQYGMAQIGAWLCDDCFWRDNTRDSTP